MSDKTKVQPTHAIEIFAGGMRMAKAIAAFTPSSDRPLTDVNAFGQSSPNAIVPGIQTFECVMEIPGAPDPTTLHRQLMQSWMDDNDLENYFDAGGRCQAELLQEKWLDSVPVILVARGLDSRLLEIGTNIADSLIPFVSEVYLGGTFREFLSMMDLGEAAYKKRITLRMLERRLFNGPVVIDTFNLADKADESGVDCAFQLTKIPLELAEGQFAIVQVNNEIWRKGYYYDASSNLIIFDDDGYCPGYPYGLFLREEHDVAAGLVTLDNAPVASSLQIQNEYDTEDYLEVVGVPAQGEFSYAGAAVTFSALDDGQTIHAHYLHQSENVPFKNITIIYVTERAVIHAGDAMFPLKGSLTP